MERILTEELKTGFTHGGAFHADDVFATALLVLINPDIRVTRGFKATEDFAGIVYDIGGGKYDHHQKDSRVRENGVPYAAFGLLWERFGTMLISDEDAREFDRSFVQPIDKADNTGEANILSIIISDKKPTWQEPARRMDDAFWEAVHMAKEMLEGRFRQIRADREAYDAVRKKAAQCSGQILCLEQVMPWKDAVRDFDILYVIYPAMRGGFNIQAVPDSKDERKLRLPFPEEWRGADKERLGELTGIDSLEFCHNSGFLCAAGTLEDAYRVAEMAMEIKSKTQENIL